MRRADRYFDDGTEEIDAPYDDFDDGEHENDESRRPRRSFVGRWIRRLFLWGLVGTVLAVGGLFLYVMFAPTPSDRIPSQTSYVTDRNGKLLATLTGGENRQVVALSEMSKWVVPAVVAAEDRRFYKHRGVDPAGIARALYQDIRHVGRRPQGGSTITQQYVKNAYVGREASALRKIKEAAIAVKLERKYTKDEILERYLNTIYWGRGAFGIEAAARAYYGIAAKDLRLSQAAYLAALLRGPETTDVVKNPEKAARRRTSVLVAMLATGAITEEQRAAVERVPIRGGARGVIDRKKRPDTYAAPDAGSEWFVDAVRRSLIDQLGEQIVQTKGLRIQTTLDLSAQRAAYKSAYGLLKSPTDPSAAVVILDHDGGVRAMVGGRDWASSQVNLATGRSGGGRGRPAGSTFKPFVLAAVLRAGYSLESAFEGPATLTIPGGDLGDADWVVKNAKNESFGTLSLAEATKKSVNTVFAQAVTNEAIGPRAVAEEAHRLGIESELATFASIALGTSEVSPLEMADAYLTFANRGVLTQPSLIVSVKTADGSTLKLARPERKRVMRAKDADVINAVLREVVRSGTGKGAAIGGVRVAGKTGTTNDVRDAWFVGYSPTACCVGAVWMGYPDSNAPMGVVNGVRVAGATLPARIFSASMRGALHGGGAGRFVSVDGFGGELLPGSTRSPFRVVASATTTSKTSTKPAAAPTVADPVPAGGGTVETVQPQPLPEPSPDTAPASEALPPATEAPAPIPVAAPG